MIEWVRGVMRLSSIIGSTALVLAAALAASAFGQPLTQLPAAMGTAQEKLAQREVLRRAALVDHQKRKDDFARRCTKRALSDTELEACRAAYRQL
jgi:hypothetical protein